VSRRDGKIIGSGFVLSAVTALVFAGGAVAATHGSGKLFSVNPKTHTIETVSSKSRVEKHKYSGILSKSAERGDVISYTSKNGVYGNVKVTSAPRKRHVTFIGKKAGSGLKLSDGTRYSLPKKSVKRVVKAGDGKKARAARIASVTSNVNTLTPFTAKTASVSFDFVGFPESTVFRINDTLEGSNEEYVVEIVNSEEQAENEGEGAEPETTTVIGTITSVSAGSVTITTAGNCDDESLPGAGESTTGALLCEDGAAPTGGGQSLTFSPDNEANAWYASLSGFTTGTLVAVTYLSEEPSVEYGIFPYISDTEGAGVYFGERSGATEITPGGEGEENEGYGGVEEE
jgi:hypothetical protein